MVPDSDEEFNHQLSLVAGMDEDDEVFKKQPLPEENNISIGVFLSGLEHTYIPSLLSRAYYFLFVQLIWLAKMILQIFMVTPRKLVKGMNLH